MKTLLDYVRHEFPNHTVELWDPMAGPTTTHDAQLTDHTVVAHVVGADDALALLRRLRLAGWHDVHQVLVHPAPRSLRRDAHEDPDGVTDLPIRRIALAMLVGGMFGLLFVGGVGWSVSGSVMGGLVSGSLGAVCVALVGAMVAGAGRFAGQRAWRQPVVPGQTIVVVAALTTDEAAARRVAALMDLARPNVVRVLGASGAWRGPRT